MKMEDGKGRHVNTLPTSALIFIGLKYDTDSLLPSGIKDLSFQKLRQILRANSDVLEISYLLCWDMKPFKSKTLNK